MLNQCLACLFVIFSLNLMSAQKIYHNEWINPNQTYYKIKVHEEGVYRISKNTLEKHQIMAEGSAYKMFFAGEEIPIYVSNNNTFAENDFIEFYGDKLNGDFDRQLFKSPDHQLHQFESLFTDTATYFLTIDTLSKNLNIPKPQTI